MTTARDRPPEEAAEDTSFARGPAPPADRRGSRRGPGRRAERAPWTCRSRPSTATCGRSATSGSSIATAASFRLGPKLLIGTGANVSSERLIRHADAALRMLVHETGETAVVVRRIGLSCVCLHQVESDAALRVTLEPGDMSPLYAGALGRVLLAFAPPEVLDEVLAQDLVRITDATPTEDELRASLGTVVMTGLAMSEGELIDGSVAVAAPVFREDGIVGAIGLLAPAFRCDCGGGRGPGGWSSRRPGPSTRRWRRTGPA